VKSLPYFANRASLAQMEIGPMTNLLSKSTIPARIFAFCFVLCPAIITVAAEPAAEITGPAGKWERMRDIVPRHYLCHATHEPITIDGRADEPAWKAAEWTEDFVDIEGSRRPKPRFRTHAKMLWDDKCLYVYAELEEPHVWATITKKNEVIFRDPDFEIFISPDGSNHHYHEYEMNALNTIWELTLEKPYRDGGPARDPDNIPGLRSAVHVRGTPNDPTDTDEGWSVEIAFPWAGLSKYAGRAASPPRDGDTWRMGFSRVEWVIDIIHRKYRKIEGRPEDNWIWSPQGIVDMHAPERWGFVQFTHEPPGKGKFKPDPTWPAREVLMEVYHRQQEFKRLRGHYAGSLKELGWDKGTTPNFPGVGLTLRGSDDGFEATATMQRPDGAPIRLHTRQDSLLW
jgi:hypothetical protein